MIRQQHIDKGKLNKLVYNKYQCDYNILLETVNCWSQYCTEQSNMLDPLYFGYVSFFTLSRVNIVQFLPFKKYQEPIVNFYFFFILNHIVMKVIPETRCAPLI
jgi:hypothetical protein